MGLNLRSLLLAAFVISNSITWTASRHHFTHNALGHRTRHRRQGAGLYLPASYVIPGGAGSGPWGDWGEVSSCSRTCGGGVASQKRICLEIAADGNATCTGGDTKYFSCETADCPADAIDFRAAQCAAYDDLPFRGIKHRWIPYTNGPNPCELNCMPKGERFYYRHKAKVTDGTLCGTESYDVCVDGTCQSVGCDMMLGSRAREDKCRRCRGDGSTCRTISGRDTQDFIKGYNDVLRIPEGATNIFIGEVKESNNYLALHSPADAVNGTKYLLNGDYHIDFPRALFIAGATWHYERRQQGFAAPDRLRCLGPTTEPLILSLLVQDENVGIDYEYSVPTSLAPPLGARYGWVFSQYSPCSVSCGTGFQTRNVTCRSLTDPAPLEDVVSESLCDADLRPPSNSTCDMGECAAEWVPGPWSPCSKNCGEGGSRNREVRCEKVITNGVSFNFRSTVSDEECFRLLGPSPALHEECNKESACPTWFTGPWKPCDQLCDEGQQTRQVVCHLKRDGRVEVLADGACADERPPERQPCMLHPCEGVDWVLSDWTGCDNCLSKVKSREVQCATKLREVVDAAFCANHPKPDLEEPCKPNELPACQAQWYATQWSNCSVECGKGVKTRLVFCGVFNGNFVETVNDSQCEGEKYKDTTPCEIPADKCPAKWFAGPWTECTKRCGGGEQFRQIMCLSGGQASTCANDTMLDSTQKCNIGSCDNDYLLPVNARAPPVIDDEEVYCEEEADGDEVGAEFTEVTDSGYSSDAPDDGSDSETGSTAETGSGDDTEETAESSTDFTQTFETDTTGSTESGPTDSTDATETVTTSSTDSTNASLAGSDSTKVTESTDSTGSTEAPETTGSEASTVSATNANATSSTGSTLTGSDSTEATETVTTNATSSTGSTLAGSNSTEITETVTTNSTDSTNATLAGSDSTEVTESTDSTGSTEATETTGSEASTVSATNANATSSTGSTLTGSDSTEATETVTTNATSSTGSTLAGSNSTEITETVTTNSTDSANATLAGSDSTEVTESTDSTGSTEATETTGSEASTVSATNANATSSTGSTLTGSDSTEATETVTTNATSSTGSTPAGSNSTEITETVTTNSTDSANATLAGSDSTEVTESTDSTGSTEATETTGSEASTVSATNANATSSTGSTLTGFDSTEATETVTTNATSSTGSTLAGSNSTEITETVTTNSTDSTNATLAGSDSTEVTESTDSTGSTEATETTGSEASTVSATNANATSSTGSTLTGSDSTEATETVTTNATSSTGSTLAGSNSTEITETVTTNSTDSTNASLAGSDSSKVTESTDSTGSTEATETTGSEASTVSATNANATSSTGSTLTGSDSTEATETVMTNATNSIGSTLAGSNSTETTETVTTNSTDSTNATLAGSDSTEVTESTDSTGSTEVTETTGSEASTVSSASTVSDITETAGSTDVTGSTEFTETGSIDVSTTEVTSESGPTETSESEGTEATGSTTESSSTTEYTGSEDTSEIGETTLWDWTSTLETTTKRQCVPRHAKCWRSAFGCCPDNKTAAAGPFDEGCLTPKTCKNTRFGCCPDGVSPATRARGKGCPPTHCELTLFGCCLSDGSTPAEGNDQEGCPPPPPACRASKYGCCKDGLTTVTSPDKRDCPETTPITTTTTATETPEPGEVEGCAASEFGCCHDNETEAAAPDGRGCPCYATEFGCCHDNETEAAAPGGRGCPCHATEFGCCPDGVTPVNSSNSDGCVDCKEHGCCSDGKTPAHGPNGLGCCLLHAYGCCPDNYTPRTAPYPDGCECQGTRFGCCPDNETIALGAKKEGCGCQYSDYGCCEDRHTAATGHNKTGCSCHTYQFGCCPDGVTVVKGPRLLGCHCRESAHGCCGDGVTAAARPGQVGCDCASSRYGCCPNGRTAATGPKFDGCTDLPVNQQSACSLPYDRGTHTPGENYTMSWYYSMQYGGCATFWYGGADGNGNRFLTKEDCEDVCVHPPAKDKCRLPKVPGDCPGSQVRWYFDVHAEQCLQFTFSGCLGNYNNFETRELCQAECQPNQNRELCAQTIERGECSGNFERWGYDIAAGRCRPFSWGGCGGSDNRFGSEAACMLRCRPAGDLLTQCMQPQEPGDCDEKIPSWSFSRLKNRCLPFYYKGCGGNDNRFPDERSCAATCPSVYEKQVCELPAVTGDCSNYKVKWFYNVTMEACGQFYYGGCGGNGNQFDSQQECQSSCAGASATTTTQRPTPMVDDVFDEAYCYLEKDSGPCSGNDTRWAYSASRGDCEPFRYGGCAGNRNSFPSREYCLHYCQSARDLCQLPMRTGGCDASVPRWFYDAASDRCSQFAFSGCDGNENNFRSAEECERQCRPGPAPGPEPEPAPEPAPQPPAEFTTTTVASISPECQVFGLERCSGVGRVWYVDPGTGRCAQYDAPDRRGDASGGEGCDARGVFPSPEACERTCGDFKGLDVCRYSLDPGSCSENQPKFYFDAETRACAPFTYGGCHGGPNRFSTINECEEICNPCMQPPVRGNCIEYHEMWYYDPERNDCHQFGYTGCGGNQNRFQSREHCEGLCKRRPAPPAPAPPTTTNTPRAEVATPAPAPAQPVSEECRAPESLEPCNTSVPAYYFDAESGTCAVAPNGACRYAGSWRSEEECERRCGRFTGIPDVCRMPLDPGPCRERPVAKIYWDMQEHRCKRFTYGGCSGGANRFSSYQECEEVCAHLAPDPACRLPAAEGAACAGAGAAGERRWFYSELHGECRPLLYLGCGGNDNNFLTFQQCASLCSPSPDNNEIITDVQDCRAAKAACAVLQCEYGVQHMRDANGCERCACIVREPDCTILEEQCANITCSYGTEITRDADGCRRCACQQHPCDSQTCPRGQRCAATTDLDPITQEMQYGAECRVENKPGACPADAPPTTGSCQRLCRDDADCRGTAKCCAAGCSQQCRAPVETNINDRVVERPHAPQPDPQTEREVAAQEGGLATLRCLFHSNPPPRITWRRGVITIDGDKDRYRLTSDGALEIVSVYRNDSGVYICIAENNLGRTEQEVLLQVNNPTRQAAGIAGPPETDIIGEVGRPLSFRCLVFGHPAPYVAWSRGVAGPMVPFDSEQYEARGNVLLIRALDVAALGVYTCQAFNGYGKPALWTVTVRAPRRDPAWPASPYLLPAAGPHPALTELPTRVATTTQSTQAAQSTQLMQSNIENPYVPYTDPVRTALRPEATTLSAGAELSLPCEVDGYPEPDVHWTKDGARLQPSDRLQLTAARLTLRDLAVGDSGEYGCHAQNEFSSHSSSVAITVQELNIPAHCTDNQFFANCRLIVHSKYCNHKYYSTFCCKSCVEAGQLNPQNLQLQADQSWMKK